MGGFLRVHDTSCFATFLQVCRQMGVGEICLGLFFTAKGFMQECKYVYNPTKMQRKVTSYTEKKANRSIKDPPNRGR